MSHVWGRLVWSRYVSRIVLAIIATFAAPAWALAASEIAVSSGRTSISSGGSFDFGRVRQGRPITKTFTIRNTGGTALELSDATAPQDFELTLAPVESVAPRRATVMRVTVPANAPSGTISGKVTVKTNDSDEQLFEINISAIVEPVAPNIVVRAADVEIAPGGDLAFNPTILGVPATRSLVITNDGNADLTISSIRVEGSDFTVAFSKRTVLRPGRRASFPIRLIASTASGPGEKEGTLVISTNDPNDNQQSFQIELRGEVAPASPGLLVLDGGNAVVPGGEVSFGRFTARPVNKTFTLRNTGRDNLEIGTVTLDGSGFLVTSQPRSPVRPGRGTRMTLRLTGQSDGSAPRALVTIPTNAEDAEAFTFTSTVEFSALGPEATVTGPSGVITNSTTIDLGTVETNSSRTVNIGIKNDGTSNLAVSGAALTGSNKFTLTTVPASSIAAGSTTRAVISFASGTTVGAAEATLNFNTSDADEPGFSVTVRANVVAPASRGDIRVGRLIPRGQFEEPTYERLDNGASVDFGRLFTGAGGNTWVFRIDSDGTGPLTVQMLADPLPAPAGFTISGYPDITPVFPQSLIPGQALVFTVFNGATSAGIKEATLRVQSDDADETPYDIRLRVEVRNITGKLNVRLGDINGTPIERNQPVGFGATQVGQPLTRTFTLFNTGEADLTIPNIPTSMMAPFVVTTQPAGTLTPGGPGTQMIVEMPAVAAGTRMLNLTIVSNDADGDFVIPLSGTINNWFVVGNPMFNGDVRAIIDVDRDGTGGADPDDIFAAGDFTTPGARIARYRAGVWSALADGGTDGTINALTFWDNDGNAANGGLIAAGGTFTMAGGSPASNVALWDGANWAALGTAGSNGVNGPVRALAYFDDDGTGPNPPRLYIGGTFATANTSGSPLTVNNVVRWDGTVFSAVGTTPVIGVGPAGASVNAFASADLDGAVGSTPRLLFIGGDFLTVGTGIGSFVAKRVTGWTGTAFSNTIFTTGIDGGATTAVKALTIFDEDGAGATRRPNLVVAGEFTNAGGIQASNIARLGQTGAGGSVVWNPVVQTSGTSNGPVNALSVVDEDGAGPSPPTLVAAGDFGILQGIGVTRVARYPGLQGTTGTWGPMTIQGANASVLALSNYQSALNPTSASTPVNRLVAGGQFTAAGGQTTIQRIAFWGTMAP